MTASADIEVFNLSVPYSVLVGLVIVAAVLFVVACGIGCRRLDKEDDE